jgi:ATP-dependent DNA helicase RecQ
VISRSQMLATLSRFWSYDSFRPGQEEIAISIAGGRDACVVMPTGGGKSLCYQLPAVIAEGRTAVVVSPLIALMQDQVAQLEEIHIPAAVLNSSLSFPQREIIRRDAERGRFRLLYFSPESITQENTLRWLKSLELSFFVIDEAHCISEWGHDFRPEYRQLKRLRREFPGRPVAAFTASATQRVRHDIVEQLGLRDPHKHIASFYRPNLRYLVRECTHSEQRTILLESLRALDDGSAIVYAPTIRRVEEVLEFLKSNGVTAVGYHGKMEAPERRRNQELWSSDKVRIVVGTVAFGLGINKSNVRTVIHLALPKSVEQYYQEAGRAGRDAVAADCLLLWQKRDAGIIGHFISETSNQGEREHAWQRYHQVREFVDSSVCRQFALCRHFGERPKWESCGNCDVCSGLPEWLSKAAREGGSSADNGPLSPQAKESLRLLGDGLSLAEIAKKRGRSLQSVENLIGAMVERCQCDYRPEWVAAPKYELICEAGARIGWKRLKPIKELLPEEVTYGEIRLVAAYQRLQARG